jgi:hypothetical protein
MNCTYSNPVDYQGNTPANSLEAFNFKELSCTIPQATQSATIATRDGELISAQGEVVRGSFVALAIIIILLGVLIGLSLFKR